MPPLHSTPPGRQHPAGARQRGRGARRGDGGGAAPLQARVPQPHRRDRAGVLGLLGLRCGRALGPPQPWAAALTPLPPLLSRPALDPLQFDPLSPPQLREVARLQARELNERLKSRSITLKLTGGCQGGLQTVGVCVGACVMGALLCLMLCPCRRRRPNKQAPAPHPPHPCRRRSPGLCSGTVARPSVRRPPAAPLAGALDRYTPVAHDHQRCVRLHGPQA